MTSKEKTELKEYMKEVYDALIDFKLTSVQAHTRFEEKLEVIETETKKTNGRVTSLEAKTRQHEADIGKLTVWQSDVYGREHDEKVARDKIKFATFDRVLQIITTIVIAYLLVKLGL